VFHRRISTSKVAVAEKTLRVVLEGREILCRLRQTRRARRIGLVLEFDGTLTVVAPPWVVITNVEALIRSKMAWILRRLDVLQKTESQRRVSDGEILFVDGREFILRIESSQSRRPRVFPADGMLVVSVPRGDERTVTAMLKAWLMSEARNSIPAHVQRIARRHSLEYKRVLVRNQRTRWGSCSSRKSLSFNWRLILLPPHVRDYLIVHELAHLSEMNHSTRFWKEVERMCPDYRTSEKWLKTNGRQLLL